MLNYVDPYEESVTFEPLTRQKTIELSLDPALWTVQTRMLRTGRFSFKGRDYLLPIYRDTHKRIKISKARQMEISELAVNWLLYNLWRYPYSIGLYMADRDSHTSKFSNLRIKDWGLKLSPVLQTFAPLRNHTATLLKLTNGSVCYFHSAWGEFAQARSIPADFAVIDERQDVDGKNINVLTESMAHSKHNRLLEIGTGDDEETDWHLDYIASDQKEWDKKSRSWIPQKPDLAEIASGYHISQEMADWITPEQLALKRKDPNMTDRIWMTEVVGGFYHGLKKPITTAMLRALFNYDRPLLQASQVDHKLGPLFMGVDWGGGERAFTVPWIEQRNIATGKSELIWTEKIQEKDVEKQAQRIAWLYNNYKPTQAVMDAGGGPFQVQQLERAFGDGMVKCFYIRTPKASSKRDYRFKDESMPLTMERKTNSVSVNRTWIIDYNISQLRGGEPLIPAADEPAIEFILDHFTAIESVLVKSPLGDYTIYDHPEDRPDDALHARNYRIIAELISTHKHKSKVGIGKLGSAGDR